MARKIHTRIKRHNLIPHHIGGNKALRKVRAKLAARLAKEAQR